jgi:hypothetical protein
VDLPTPPCQSVVGLPRRHRSSHIDCREQGVADTKPFTRRRLYPASPWHIAPAHPIIINRSEILRDTQPIPRPMSPGLRVAWATRPPALTRHRHQTELPETTRPGSCNASAVSQMSNPHSKPAYDGRVGARCNRRAVGCIWRFDRMRYVTLREREDDAGAGAFLSAGCMQLQGLTLHSRYRAPDGDVYVHVNRSTRQSRCVAGKAPGAKSGGGGRGAEVRRDQGSKHLTAFNVNCGERGVECHECPAKSITGRCAEDS